MLNNPPQEIINDLVKTYNNGQLILLVKKAQKFTFQYPNSFIIWNILGAAQKGLGNTNEAFQAFQKVTKLNPRFPDGFSNLGAIQNDQSKFHDAVKSCKKALLLKPNFTEAYYNMGNAFKELGKLEKAINIYKKAIAIKPDYIEAYNNMGNCFQIQEKFEEALDIYNKALFYKPGHIETIYNIGKTYNDLGKLEDSIKVYNKVLELKDDYAEAHRNLSRIIKYKINNPQINKVESLLNKTNINEEDKCHLYYAFAKMQEDIGKLDYAFDNYKKGGALRKKMLSYDFEKDKILFNKIKNFAPYLKKNALSTPSDSFSIKPIFILGMPRSGTTLVEQIISCHPLVHGGGELTFLEQFGFSIIDENPKYLSKRLLNVRKNYLNKLKEISNGKSFVSDKLPHNFLHIGLICGALPEAKIIHVKRDAAATCWSNFKHYFSVKGLGFSYDLKCTVRYYKLYQKLMKFWDKMYENRIFHLNYDKLTISQESETKKLIQHLELDWDDKCLFPYKNKRHVLTASQQQVREKIYQGSSREWLKFEPYLDGEFEKLIN